jgi:hypothetical protein
VWAKDQRLVELVDLAVFGRPARFVWHKRCFGCPTSLCAVGLFTETALHISAARLVMTDRARRWVTEQVRRCRTQRWSSEVVDVRRGQLLDVIADRSTVGACEWFAEQDRAWPDSIRWATLDLSGPWRLAFTTMLPGAIEVADPFHVVKLANQRLDGPLYGSRPQLT